MIKWIVTTFIGLLFTSACSPGLQEPKNALNRYEIIGEAQGSTYSMVYYADSFRITKPAVDSILNVFDLAASTWVPTSVISQVNNDTTGWVSLAGDEFGFFTTNFLLSKSVYEVTQGAFNPTVGKLVNAWGFGFSNKLEMDSAKVDSLLATVGFEDSQMRLDSAHPAKLIKTNPYTYLDFNAIAQGQSIDVVADYFQGNGVFNYMIEVGGELIAHGTKSDGKLWRIGIDLPVEGNLERKLAATIALNNKALATSGNYRKFYEKDGIKYAHTISPFTGFPVQHSLLSVTLVMDNCAWADALATAFMVMGKDDALAFMNAHPEMEVEGYFIWNNSQGNIQTYITPGLASQLTEIEH